MFRSVATLPVLLVASVTMAQTAARVRAGCNRFAPTM